MRMGNNMQAEQGWSTTKPEIKEDFNDYAPTELSAWGMNINFSLFHDTLPIIRKLYEKKVGLFCRYSNNGSPFLWASSTTLPFDEAIKFECVFIFKAPCSYADEVFKNFRAEKNRIKAAEEDVRRAQEAIDNKAQLDYLNDDADIDV